MSSHIYRYNSRIQKRSYKWVIWAIMALLVLLGISRFKTETFSNNNQFSAEFNSSSIVNKLNLSLPTPQITPEWPKSMQSAVGAIGYGVLAQSQPNPQPIPMASLAKVMAAILIIETDGLTQFNPGKNIIFSLEDEAFYNKYLFEGGVVTTIKAGESISQRDALKAMLIGSSNNLADTSVIASFKNMPAYLEAANAKAVQLGMNQTTFKDVTGFSPESTSTASDLLLLAEYAMKNPLFAEIVATWQTTILGNVKLTNTNTFLDFEDNKVIGIKSGLTDEAGGTFMTAAQYQTKNGDTIVALAVTLGAKTHFEAQQAAMPLLISVRNAFNSQ
jgi:D-alanyl-D-alanine carboxypeptidase (penicillin-binding protein 5/6)